MILIIIIIFILFYYFADIEYSITNKDYYYVKDKYKMIFIKHQKTAEHDITITEEEKIDENGKIIKIKTEVTNSIKTIKINEKD